MIGAGLESTLARAVPRCNSARDRQTRLQLRYMAMGTLFAWLLVLRGVNMPCSRTTRCCQCHVDQSHDLSIRIPMLYHYVTTLPIYFMLVGLFELMVMSGRCLDFMGLFTKIWDVMTSNKRFEYDHQTIPSRLVCVDRLT